MEGPGMATAALHLIGNLVDDLDEEIFLLFSLDRQQQRDLGMLDSRAEELDVSIGNHDFCIKQSPGLLTSSRAAGTTGACVWRTSQVLAAWFDSGENPLFRHRLLSTSSIVLELGSGSGGLLPLILGPRVAIYCATDQDYALRLLRHNIDANHNRRRLAADLRIFALDWETDDIQSCLSTNAQITSGADLLVACDCVYNYHLINPFVQTCVDACRTPRNGSAPTLCLVAQQLRQPDVFEQWLSAFSEHFLVWRLKDEVLGTALAPSAGYVVHIGVLRSQ